MCFSQTHIIRQQRPLGEREEERADRLIRIKRQLEEVEPRRAEMDALHRPVAKACDAKRAAVAHALGKDAPRVGQVVTVVPDRAEHLEVVIGLGPADPVGHEAYPEARP